MLLINYCLHFEHHIVKAQKMKGTTQKKNRNFTSFGDVSGNIAQMLPCNSLIFTDGYKNAVILYRKKNLFSLQVTDTLEYFYCQLMSFFQIATSTQQ